jgi:hypothetical protein
MPYKVGETKWRGDTTCKNCGLLALSIVTICGQEVEALRHNDGRDGIGVRQLANLVQKDHREVGRFLQKNAQNPLTEGVLTGATPETVRVKAHYKGIQEYSFIPLDVVLLVQKPHPDLRRFLENNARNPLADSTLACGASEKVWARTQPPHILPSELPQ